MTLPTQELAPQRSETPSRHLRHIRELDGIRGIAALMVFFHHLCFTSIEPAQWGATVVVISKLCHPGNSGVDLFFTLSGFLITSLLIEARTSNSYYQDFYWKRALRILPLYLLCLLGIFFIMPGAKSYAILSLLFIANFASAFHVYSQGPFWTLAIEEQFYLLWPTVVRRRTVPQLRLCALLIGLTAIGLRLIAAFYGHYNYDLTFFRCDGLASGALIACWFSQRDLRQPLSPKETRSIGAACVGGILLIALGSISTERVDRFAFIAAAYQTGVTLLAGSLIAYLVTHTGQKNIRWLRAPVLTFFGLISYAMYMTHLYVMFCYDFIFGILPPGSNLAYIIRLISVLATTIAVCLLSRYLIELPATSLRKYVLAKPDAS